MLLADLVNVLNLEMYVIGGGASSAWDAFAPTMFEELRQRSIVYVATAPSDPLGSNPSRKKANVIGRRTDGDSNEKPSSLAP